MDYFLIRFDNGQTILEEVFCGNIQRWCDIAGNTIEPPNCGSVYVGPYAPSFPIPPDPAPPEVVAPVEDNQPAPVVQDTMIGLPIRTYTYDDKGQLIRIDYPQSEKCHLMEYERGRLVKLSEYLPTGATFVRRYYYDEWGRMLEVNE